MECTGWGIGGGQGVVSGVHRVGYRRGAGCGEWSVVSGVHRVGYRRGAGCGEWSAQGGV